MLNQTAGWGTVLLLLGLLAAVGGCVESAPDEPLADRAPTELRGVWLTNVDSDVLNSRAGIDEAMQFLADHHFNVVYPVVWNDAYTLYPSAVTDSLLGYRVDPEYAGRDPLAELIEAAHEHGLAVIPWFEFGFAASYQADGGPIIDAKPDWAARDREGNLLTKNGFEWMNAYHPEVQDFLRSLVLEVVRNYDVDGVQGDDRLPAQPVEGGYAAFTDSLYRATHDGTGPPQDPTDADWKRWRADRLNAFAQRLYRDVKAIDPALQVSWAPSIYPWGYDEYLQDWPAWLDGGYADWVHPQVYRRDLGRYRETLASQQPNALGLDPATQERIVPGVLMQVGDYRISADDLVEVVAANRAQGVRGEVFFFYEGLRANDGALADTLLATHYAEPAALPFERASAP
jgi:uncharacterized lipoprotein YddW (UPF0748 family)